MYFGVIRRYTDGNSRENNKRRKETVSEWFIGFQNKYEMVCKNSARNENIFIDIHVADIIDQTSKHVASRVTFGSVSVTLWLSTAV